MSNSPGDRKRKSNSLRRIFLAGTPPLLSAVLSLAAIRLYSNNLNPADFGSLMLCIGGISLVDALLPMALSQTSYFLQRQSDGVAKTERLIHFFASKKYLVASTLAGVSLVGLNQWGLSTAALAIAFPIYAYAESIRAASNSVIHLNAPLASYIKYQMLEQAITFIASTTAIYATSSWKVYLPAILISKSFCAYLSLRALSPPNHNSRREPSETKAAGENILKHIVQLSSMGLLGWTLSYADRYSIAIFLGTAAAGSFSVASGLIGRPFSIISTSLTNNFRPSLALPGSGIPSRCVPKWIAISTAIGLGMALCVYLLRDQVLDLLLAKEHREQAKSIIGIVAIAWTFTIATHAMENELMARGFNTIIMKCQILGAITTTILAAVFGTAFGIVGAASARAISELVRALLTWRQISILSEGK